jgi:hypothetical protein
VLHRVVCDHGIEKSDTMGKWNNCVFLGMHEKHVGAHVCDNLNSRILVRNDEPPAQRSSWRAKANAQTYMIGAKLLKNGNLLAIGLSIATSSIDVNGESRISPLSSKSSLFTSASR